MVSAKIQLSDTQKRVLDKNINQRNARVSLQERSLLVSLMDSGYSNLRIKKEVGFSEGKSRRWRARWLSFAAIFSQIESDFEGREMERELEKAISGCLSDEPRPGAPCTISTEQYCQILGVSLEPPEKSDRPITQWTLDELTDEVIKRGIVETISRAQVGAFLKGERSKAAQNGGLAQPEL